MVNGFYKGTIADIGREGEENIAPEGLCGFFCLRRFIVGHVITFTFFANLCIILGLVHASLLLF